MVFRRWDAGVANHLGFIRQVSDMAAKHRMSIAPSLNMMPSFWDELIDDRIQRISGNV